MRGGRERLPRMGVLHRSTFLGAVAAFAAVPFAALAQTAKKRYECRARLVRLRDNIVINEVTATVDDGATGDAIDGQWQNSMPRRPQGLYVKFTPKSQSDGQVDLKWAAEEGLVSVNTGTSTGSIVDSKTDGEDPFPANAEREYLWNISGEPYKLVVSCRPA